MSPAVLRIRLVVPCAVLLFVTTPLSAQVIRGGTPGGDSALFTTSQSAPFDYTLTLANTGPVDINTFWFAVTNLPNQSDLLPTIPTNITEPSGWTAFLGHTNNPGDGFSIKYSNVNGAPITSGGGGIFHFTSSDSPTILAGASYVPGIKISSSWIFDGVAGTGNSFQFDTSVSKVPEPASVVTLLIGCALALITLRR
jgi:hypothetical protein